MPETPTGKIRPGTPEDLQAVVTLQLVSWRDAYRGLLPDAYLDGALADDLAAKWRGKLIESPDPRTLLLVAESPAGLGGFFYAAQETPGDAHAYLDNLHVRPELRGHGLGEALMRAAVPMLQARGYRGMHLLVSAENAAAIRFYRRLGGRVAARGVEDLMGHAVDTCRIVWPDWSAFAQ